MTGTSFKQILQAEMQAPWARGLRIFLLLVMALLQLRFYFTTRDSAFLEDQPLAKFCLWYALLGMLWSPFKTVLGAAIMAPLFSLYYISSNCENPGLAYLPLAAAGPAWVVWTLARRRRTHLRVSGLGFLADAFALSLVVKMAVAAFTPSLINSLWRLRSAPLDFPYSECQFMNVGFYLLNMLMLFQVADCEAGRTDLRPALKGALLLQFVAVSMCALAQALMQWPSFTRNGLHSPFVGVHEMGFYMAIHCVLWGGWALFERRRRPLWALLAGLAFALLIGSNSKTSMVCTLLAGVLLGMLHAGRRSLLPVAVLGTLSCVGVWLLSRYDLPLDPATAARVRAGFALTLNPYAWWQSGESRVALYGKALLLIRDRPLDGVGVGDYRVSHTPETVALMKDMTSEYLRDHDSHNLLLNLACENGLPTLGLFLLWMTALQVRCLGEGGWGKAVGVAILTGLSTNLTNCVLCWPFQGVTFGLLLALTLPTPESPPVAAASRRYLWLLLPALLNLVMAPWSVSRDHRLQDSAFGFRRWDWFPDEREDIAVFPEASIPIAAEAGLARMVIKKSPWVFDRETPRVSVFIDGRKVLSDQAVSFEPTSIAVPPPAPGQPTVIGVVASNPFGAMRWPALVGQFWLFRIELYDAQGQQIDVRKLPAFSEQVKRLH